MDNDKLVGQVEICIGKIAGKYLEGVKPKVMDAMVTDFVREEVRGLDRDQILARFDTPARSLAALCGYLDRRFGQDLGGCCDCWQEPACTPEGR